MFDMRYHIASLVAVFLALTVGIVLGTAIVNRGVLVRQQASLVAGLRQEFGTLRDRNRALQEQVDRDEEFFKAALPLLIDKRLAGKRVAVISTESQDTVDVRQTVIALRQGGAKVNVVTILSPDLGSKDPAMAAKLQKVFPRERLTGQRLKERLISEIATQLAVRAEPAFLRQLAEIGVVKISSTNALPAKDVVLLAGSGKDDAIAQFQIPLIEALKKAQVVAVGVESSGIELSVMGRYQDAGANTVDNIDSAIGEISLVLSLGGSPGHYGQKRTADALMPKLETP